MIVWADCSSEDEIEYGYMVKNKFICYSETYGWIDIDEFNKLFPGILKKTLIDLFICINELANQNLTNEKIEIFLPCELR